MGSLIPIKKSEECQTGSRAHQHDLFQWGVICCRLLDSSLAYFNPIDPHVDVWCNSKKDPLYQNWVVVIPFEESGDPALRNRFADSLAQQIGHLPGFRKENDNLITQSIHLKLPQARQTAGWFTVIGDMGGD